MVATSQCNSFPRDCRLLRTVRLGAADTDPVTDNGVGDEEEHRGPSFSVAECWGVDPGARRVLATAINIGL